MAKKAGESAQREYERRAAKDSERRRSRWKRSLALVVLTFPLTYVFVQGVIWGINDWFVPEVLDGVSETVADSQDAVNDQPQPSPEDADQEPTVPSKLANQLGLGFATLATISMARSAWGRRQSTEAWAQGAAGERKTGSALDGLPPGFVALHDLKMPGSRGNIDHLVVGPTGVFTVETKNYQAGVVLKSGRATGAGRSLDKVVDQATRQAEAMSRVLGLDVRPIVCVQGGPLRIQGFFQKPTVGGVRFCAGKDLRRLLAKGPTVLSPTQIETAAGIAPDPAAAKSARGRVPGKTEARSERSERIAPSASPAEQVVERRTPPTPMAATQTCRCGAEMVLRTRRSDNNAFFGCSTYPRCRHTLPA